MLAKCTNAHKSLKYISVHLTNQRTETARKWENEEANKVKRKKETLNEK